MIESPLISMREVLSILFRYQWSIIFITVSTVALVAFAVYYLISPSYQSQATIILNNSYLTQPLRDAPPDSDLEKMVSFHTQRDILVSTRIATEAVKRTNLAERRVIGRIERIKMFIGDVKRWVGGIVGIERWTKPWDPGAAAVAAVEKGIQTAAVPDSKAIRVTYRAKNAAEAAEVLNAILEAHGEYYHAVIRDRATGVIRFLEEEFEHSQNELAAAEKALLDFRMRDRLAVSLPASLKEEIPQGFTGVTDNVKVQQELKLYVLKMEDELRASREIVDNEKRSRIQRDLREQIARYVEVLNAIPEKELTLVRLRRDFENAQDNFLLLQRNLTRARLVADGQTESMRLIEIFEAAKPKETPVFPKKRIALVLGSVMGAMLALTWAFVSAYLDSRFYGAKDVKELNVRLLSSLPVIG